MEPLLRGRGRPEVRDGLVHPFPVRFRRRLEVQEPRHQRDLLRSSMAERERG